MAWEPSVLTASWRFSWCNVDAKSAFGWPLERCHTRLWVGLAIGTGAGFGALRLLQSVVVGVTANDPAPLLVVPSLLAIISYLACVVPARRAGRENTLAVLRE